MLDPALKKLSRFMSLVLRHQPEVAGITLDTAGWVSIEELLRGVATKGFDVTRSELLMVVRENDKQRFAISGDGLRIRASQGHSIPVELGLEPLTPPQILYHGSVWRHGASISSKGILKLERQHVHLSDEYDTAQRVGRRHCDKDEDVMVLTINAFAMHRDGHQFFRSDNGVWLTDHVPFEYVLKPRFID